MTTTPTPVARSVVLGIALASALVPLNSTMVAVALPRIAKSFDIGRGRAGALITVYLVIMLIGQPLSGRLSDVIGTLRAVVFSLLGFAACSTAAVFANTFDRLVVARGLQAVFASALAPSVQSMLRAITAPEHRGHVFGILGSVIGVGAASGPVIGGVLVSLFGWHSVFAVNIPVVVVALAVLWAVEIPDAHTSVIVDPLACSAAVAGKARPRPSIWNRVFVCSFATQASSNLGQYSLLLIAPIVFDARGWSSAKTGLALSALTVGLIIMGPPGGRYGDTAGRRRSVGVGLGIAMSGTLLLVPFGADIAPVALIVGLLTFGLGTGFASPGIMAAGLGAAPPERAGYAAGVLSMSRYFGSIAASILVSKFVSDNGGGTRLMYTVTFVALLFATSTSRGLPAISVPTVKQRERTDSPPPPSRCEPPSKRSNSTTSTSSTVGGPPAT